MRRNGIAAGRTRQRPTLVRRCAPGAVFGNALLALLIIWSCGCAAKHDAPGSERAPDAGSATASAPADGGLRKWEMARRDPMEADNRATRTPEATRPHAGPRPEGDRPAERRERKIDELLADGKTLLPDDSGEASKKRYREHMERAKRANDAENLDRALSEYERAARLAPDAGRKREAQRSVGEDRTRREREYNAAMASARSNRVTRVPRAWQTDLATDELWVIERPGAGSNQPVAADPDTPTQGELRATVTDGSVRKKEVPLPLEHTDVKASVAAFVATVDVTQRYRNPFDTKIEAVYVFPLPQNAAVTDFIMTIGERRIRGLIREREEARRIYREAKRQGHVASLLTQERPTIFTQRVANIEPLKAIGITIRYFNTLKYSNGEYEFVFPMVVGPRYNPPGWKDGIGAVAKGKAGTSGQPVEVQYLKPGERSGHNISLTLDVDAGVDIEGVKCPTHAV